MNDDMKGFLLAIIAIVTTVAISQAQNTKGTVKGRIYSSDGQPASFVSIGVKGTDKGIQTDENGIYEFILEEGKYTLQVKFIGHEPEEEEVVIKAGESVILPDFKLKESAKELQEVEVTGKTETQEVRESSYNVTAIDAKPLHNTSQDINQVLNKTAGVRVREDGGLGSSFNFSLNGFSGRQVKFFLDGIPMDNFGSSLTLNNVPINLAERIEVYKGVLPIWLGSDALGGAVNIVTNQKMKNFADVSYSYGSFNTHRTSINLGYTNKKNGFAVFANAFQNFSDNTYWVDVPVKNLENLSLGPEQRVKRFHDTYRSETFQVEMGLVGKKYADKLLVGIILSQSGKDIQTAAQMSKVYGGRAQYSTTVMPTFKYKKSNLLIKGLDLNMYGAFNLGSTRNVDTLNREYNWAGQYKDNSRDKNGFYVPGAEDSRSLYRFKNNLVIASANLSYAISKSHSIGINYVFSSFERKGSDPLKPEEEAYKQPQILKKSTIGLGYKFDLNKRWSTSVFAKQYILDGESAQRVDIYTNPRWEPIYNTISRQGYGIATSFFVHHTFQLKGSFENTYRLPEGEEMFGDGINHVANKNLKPEGSQNINAGFLFNRQFGEKHRVVLEGNFIYRNASDFIRTDVLDTRTQSMNIRGVRNTGVDGDIRYSIGQSFNMGVNATYQKLINTQKYETPGSLVVSPVYLDQIPNVPYLFANADVGFRFNRVVFPHAKLGLNYSLNYVEEYYLKWPSQGGKSGKNVVPQQISHNISLTYSIKEGRYNLSLECRNLTDAKLYDNFLMQKPGRALYVKLRYFISK